MSKAALFAGGLLGLFLVLPFWVVAWSSAPSGSADAGVAFVAGPDSFVNHFEPGDSIWVGNRSEPWAEATLKADGGVHLHITHPKAVTVSWPDDSCTVWREKCGAKP